MLLQDTNGIAMYRFYCSFDEVGSWKPSEYDHGPIAISRDVSISHDGFNCDALFLMTPFLRLLSLIFMFCMVDHAEHSGGVSYSVIKSWPAMNL